jgi:transposase
MRLPHLHPWLSAEGLLDWVQQSPTVDDYRRRLSVWLTQAGPFPAMRVAELLGVSVQSVWSWVGDYNRQGPGALVRSGRGGRRWSFLSLKEEADLLARFRERAARGEVITAKHLHREVCQHLGRQVSIHYVYKVLHRHRWRKLAPRPRHVQADPAAQAAFKKPLPKPLKKR